MTRRRYITAAMAAAAISLLVIVLPVITGCTTTIRPPASVNDPVSVYVLDHGHTPSLLLPTADGEAVRYAYGDWMYYAESERHPLWNGAPALLWPTPSGVGRQQLDRMPPPDPQAIAAAIGIHVDDLYVLRLERQRVDALHDDLEAYFRQRWDERLLNESAGLTFVPHEERYSLAHDSNHMVAHWLGALGVDSSGPFWAINWRVDEGGE